MKEIEMSAEKKNNAIRAMSGGVGLLSHMAMGLSVPGVRQNETTSKTKQQKRVPLKLNYAECGTRRSKKTS
jgi:hypothetical protein